MPLNDKDLRVKKDVSDLKLDPLFWGRVIEKKLFFRQQQKEDPRAACGGHIASFLAVAKE